VSASHDVDEIGGRLPASRIRSMAGTTAGCDTTSDALAAQARLAASFSSAERVGRLVT
jgi:hypothetical protein